MIDESRLAPYYTKIAEKLDEMIPVEWIKINMYAEELGDTRSVSFYYYISNDEKIHHSGDIREEFGVNHNTFKMLEQELIAINKELWLEFKNAGEQPWCVLSFSLDCEGNFKINYEYEINMEIGRLEREIRWAYDTLNIISEDDYEKELLEEYLEEKGQN